MSEEVKSPWVDIAFKVLAALVIPLFGWGLKIHTDNAVLKHKIEALEKQVEKSKEIKTSVDDNKGNLIAVKTKLSNLNGTMNEIKQLLQRQNDNWQRLLLDRSRNRRRPTYRRNRRGYRR